MTKYHTLQDLANLCQNDNIQISNDEAFIWFCSNGWLKGARKLYSLGIKNGTEIPAFVDSCRSNRLEMAKWLDGLFSITDYRKNLVFGLACSWGNLEICQWLHEQGVINKEEYRGGFHHCLSNGRLDILKWLYQNSNVKITERDFENAVKDDKLDIAKWLYSVDSKTCLNTDIYGLIENSKSREMKDWLESLEEC